MVLIDSLIDRLRNSAGETKLTYKSTEEAKPAAAVKLCCEWVE